MSARKAGRMAGRGSAPHPVVAIGSHLSSRAAPSAYAGEYRENFICRSAPVSTAQPLRAGLIRLTSALTLRTMPTTGHGGQTGSLLPLVLARWGGQLHVSQQAVHDLMEGFPGRLAVALVAHHQRIAGIELFIKHMPAGKFGPHQVPGELVELVALGRRDRRRLPPALEGVAQAGVSEDVDRGRHEKRNAAEKRAQHVDDLGVVLLTPVERRIHDAPVRRGVAWRPFLPGLDLTLHQPADGCLERGEAPERLTHGRNLVDAVGLTDAARHTDNQAELRPEADVGMVVLVAVRRRLDIDAPRHGAVVV